MNKYFATTQRGLEELLAQELESLEAQEIKTAKGGVEFSATLATLYRANLCITTAIRILQPIKDFSAVHAPMLYDQVRRLKWEQIFKAQSSFVIDAVFSKNKDRRHIDHSLFAAQKIKDAIADRFREKLGMRPSVDKKDPDIRIHAYFYDDRCQLSLDCSGRSLHERGYRSDAGEAPFKENIAAAILQFMHWNDTIPLVDPMCGSGTILIEAARQARKIPAAYFRKKFGFMEFNDFNPELWKNIQNEIFNKIDKNKKAMLFGYDIEERQILNAKKNARWAEVADTIILEKKNLTKLTAPAAMPGILFFNPPYGERLGNIAELEPLYQSIGDLLKKQFQGWMAYVLSGNPELSQCIGLRASKKIPLWNGPIDCRLLEYKVY